jgi:hypothetical protein
VPGFDPKWSGIAGSNACRKQEGMTAAIKPIDTEEFLATLAALVDHREIC